MKRLAILGSDSGATMQAISDEINRGAIDAEIVIVGSNDPAAYIVERAQSLSIPTFTFESDNSHSRLDEELQENLAQHLDNHEIDLVCLAGFDKKITKVFLERFPGSVINITPEILSACPDKDEWKDDNHVTSSGCTVHYLDRTQDNIIAQSFIPVFPEDNPQFIERRIEQAECKLYPKAVAKVLKGLDN